GKGRTSGIVTPISETTFNPSTEPGYEFVSRRWPPVCAWPQPGRICCGTSLCRAQIWKTILRLGA
ncbi:MAG: hypothetical protein J2P16_13550, partial [Mycobacterium sp.]|nr:hypothetical protein [Mycobacterium sp.]